MKTIPRPAVCLLGAALALLAGCASESSRRIIHLHVALGEEIDGDEVDELLEFAWDRHIHGKSLDRDRAVREGVWLAMQHLDATEAALSPEARARVLAAAGGGRGQCASAIAMIRTEWNRAFPSAALSYSALAERTLDAIYRRLDPHSAFFPKREWTSLVKSISGEYSGIGVLVTHADEPVISEVFEDGPSHGLLRRNDRIVEVDGKGVKGLAQEEYLAMIRGNAGSAVRVGVRRGEELVAVTIVRREMKARAVRTARAGKAKDVLVFRLWSFLEGSGEQLARALRNAEKPLRGVILDLRNNPGGTVDDAVAIVDLFIDTGIVIVERGREDEIRYAEEDGAYLAGDVPVIVLVNRFSASASELVAGSLRDHGRAVLMGETTYGKGTVQEIYRFGDRGAKVTAARFHLPSGRSTQLVGVPPDIAFEDAEALKVAQELRGSGERVLERDYENAVTPDIRPSPFRAGADLGPLVARLRGRLGASGPSDPEVDADDAMLQEAVRLLDGEPAR